MNVPFLNLAAQYADIRSELEPAVLATLRSTQYVLGPAVGAFEESFAAYTRSGNAVAVNSGTSALHIALAALGIGSGCEVVTVAHTFVATVAAICYCGAKPVFVDIEPGSMTMDPAKLKAAVTPRTKAIIPVHIYGQAADLDAIDDIARRLGIPVVEDACQAHGAKYNGKMIGESGNPACFSFYPGKNLGAGGEGGCVTSPDRFFAEKARMLRDWGAPVRYRHEALGYNYRMDAVQGTILGVKLGHLERWNAARRRVAERYGGELDNPDIELPRELPGRRHVYHIYAIRTKHRESLQQHLHGLGVQTNIHYPVPVHMQKGYAFIGGRAGDLPVTERVAAETLSLPMCPYLSREQIDHVIRSVNSFKRRR